MEVRAVSKYLRIGPRKVRLVLGTIRRKPANQALAILQSLNKKAARLVYQTLKSAIANAKVKKLDPNTLFVSVAKADGGPVLKRFMSRAMGRADRILKRTSHVTIVLSDGVKTLPATPQPTGKPQVAEKKPVSQTAQKKVPSKISVKKQKPAAKGTEKGRASQKREK